MPRPRRLRRIFNQPDVTFFKPAGVPLRILNEIILSYEELESIRLTDLKQMEQSKAAKKMNVSQPTFSRLLKSARKKISEAVVKGRAIKICGGDFEFCKK